MDILSYRGPGSPGGVSGALSRAMESHGTHNAKWWHQSGNSLFVRQRESLARHVCTIAPPVVDGHYEYCNNFLWPVMHDLSDFASLCLDDWVSYQQFNLAFAINVLNKEESGTVASYFVQDYQLALVPALSNSSPRMISLFWHIPWPKSIKEEFVPFVAEIAYGLLAATKVGFHISEYALNFLKFVDIYLPDYSVDYESQTVSSVAEPLTSRSVTEVIVQPLGLDLEFWKRQSSQGVTELDLLNRLTGEPYVLSVDRADYTKGVLQRLHSIDEFFDMYPSWLKQITFVQLCQPTRVGLKAFDNYWDKCVAKVTEINSRWGKESWVPIIWVEEPMSPGALAHLYRNAKAMLVNPLRDGLNLTAKEFVACADDNGGALLMSKGAGAWQELGALAVPVEPLQARAMASAIATALTMSQGERRSRIIKMKETLQDNNLTVWWQRFCGRSERVPASRFAHRQAKLLRII